MSGQSKKTKVVTANSGVVLSPVSKRHGIHAKLATLAAISLVALAVVIGVVVLLLRHHNAASSVATQPTTDKSTYSGAVPTASAEAYAAVTSAEDQADGGDYQGAQSNLDSAITKAGSNKASQGILYEGKAMLAENAKQYADALQFARQAEALSPTANSALIIARVSEDTGDKATAITYYKKTADRTTGYDKQEYIDDATELSK